MHSPRISEKEVNYEKVFNSGFVIIGSCLFAQAADPPTKNNIKVDEKAAWILATDAADQPATVKTVDTTQ